FAAEHLESARGEELFEIAATVIEEVARDIDAVPRAAEQAELPGGGIGGLDDQAAAGFEEGMRGGDVGARIVEVLEDVEHGDAAEAAGGERRGVERGANGWGLLALPGDGSGVAGIIEAEHAEAALAHHAEK